MFYQSYLQVVFQFSVAKAGYVMNIFNLVSCTWAVLISICFRYTDTFKWAAFVAVPGQLIMTMMLIWFRAPGSHISILILVEVVNAMAGAIFVQVEQVAVMAAVPHENVAAGLALLLMVTSIGGSIGQTVSGAVWTQIVPHKLVQYLPAASKHRAAEIYASLDVQLALPWGSSEREAVIRAYGDAQKIMLIVGICALMPCFLWICMLKNYRLSEHMNRRGVQA